MRSAYTVNYTQEIIQIHNGYRLTAPTVIALEFFTMINTVKNTLFKCRENNGR